jgi:membrane protein YqaA with SNARE-associated domain
VVLAEPHCGQATLAGARRRVKRTTLPASAAGVSRACGGREDLAREKPVAPRVRRVPIMVRSMEAWIHSLLVALALPEFGLSTVFLISLISATLLPLGSEPAVFGLIKLNPDLFWPAIVVATVGNTIGGAISWWMGYGAEVAYERVAHRKPMEIKALSWLERFGPRACLLSWLPGVGDPLCAVAGWMRMPFWPCVGYMAVGKFARYVTMTVVLLWVFPGRFAS